MLVFLGNWIDWLFITFISVSIWLDNITESSRAKSDSDELRQ